MFQLFRWLFCCFCPRFLGLLILGTFMDKGSSSSPRCLGRMAASASRLFAMNAWVPALPERRSVGNFGTCLEGTSDMRVAHRHACLFSCCRTQTYADKVS